MNKPLSHFIPLYAAVIYVLLLNHSMASAGATVIGRITPSGLAIQGILGITFDGEANPLVLDGSGKTIWRLDLHDANVISTLPLSTEPQVSRSLEFDATTGRYFTSRRFPTADYLSAVDPFAGNVTDIGVIGFFNFLGMAIHPLTGDLWLVNDCANIGCTASGGSLWRVNKFTGATTPVHEFGTSLGQLTALAISPQGRFFVASLVNGFSRIYELDPISGESTFITETGLGFISILMDMAFDPSTNRLYGIEQRRGDEPPAWYLVEVTGLPPLEVDVVEVGIDIKPGSDPNCFNNNERGVIPVAILSSVAFNATHVDPGTVQLAGLAVKVAGKSNKYLAHTEDVNRDGLVDLMVQIEDTDQIFTTGTTTAKLTGTLYDGTVIVGEDEICRR